MSRWRQELRYEGFIDRVIHLSRLLVSSLDELSNAELLLVGHRFNGVVTLLETTGASVIDLAPNWTRTAEQNHHRCEISSAIS